MGAWATRVGNVRAAGARCLGGVSVLMSALALVVGGTAHASPDLDPAFSGDGWQTTGLGRDFAIVHDVVVQPDGKIVVAGRAGNSSPDFGVSRFNADGSPDTTFSSDGSVTTDLGGWDEASSVALQSDGRIVVAGYTANPDYRFAVVRYNADGSLDTTFSDDGMQTTDFGGFDGANGVAVQSDGRIVVVGYRNIEAGPGSEQVIDWALLRYLPDGTLDSSFSTDGKQTTDFGGSAAARAVAVLSDGRLVVTGSAGGNFGVARYASDGSLDTSFSSDGKQTTDFGNNDFANALAIQADGRIVASGGSKNGSSSKFALARYTSDGSLDTTLSDDGRQTTDFPGGIDVANGVAIDTAGKLVLAGGLTDTLGGEAPPYDMALARYSPDGSLDATFSDDGMHTTDLGGFEAASGGVALQSDGKIVLAGRNSSLAVVARYLVNGAPASPADTTPPEITIAAPVAGQLVEQGATFTTVFSCSDPGGSGVDICVGPTTLDTSSAGGKSFTVIAVDKAGNRASRTVNYLVGDGVSQSRPLQPTPSPPLLPTLPSGGFAATDSQIIAALGRVLSPTGKAAKIAALLKSGYSFTFSAPGAGKLRIDWYYLPKGAKLAANTKKKPRPTTIATGAVTSSNTGAIKIRLKLTSAGKKKLKKAKRLRLTTQASFTPADRKPLLTRTTLTIKR